MFRVAGTSLSLDPGINASRKKKLNLTFLRKRKRENRPIEEEEQHFRARESRVSFPLRCKVNDGKKGRGEKKERSSQRSAIEDSIIAGSSFAAAIRLAASNYRSVIGAEFLLSLNSRSGVRIPLSTVTPAPNSSLIKPIKPATPPPHLPLPLFRNAQKREIRMEEKERTSNVEDQLRRES